VRGERHAPADLPSVERPVTHFTGGWVAPRRVWTDFLLWMKKIHSK